MKAQEIAKKIEKAAGSIVETKEEISQPYIKVKRENIHEVISHLKSEDSLKFDFLRCITGIDNNENLEIVYHLFSYDLKHEIVIKADIPKDNSSIDSISDIYGVANWYEREAFDLSGISFNNHPDMRRIMLPDDWEGHPLRKDYEYPKEYRGITHER